ncbi:MAG: 5'-nucleotidase C-terminal domain-containing protein [Holophagaceae bacterium]|nr:5'-nucleotidase C-terminal domain-containing protein [Holophagaceae bacterium]
MLQGLSDWHKWFLCFALVFALHAQEGREQKIQIIATANTFAAIRPIDPFSMSPSNRGWGRLSTALRAEIDNNSATVLIDCGDTLLGDPMGYVLTKTRPSALNPIIDTMNDLGYMAMVPGSFDFGLGLPWLKTAERQARFTFIAANVFDSFGKEIFRPYIKTTINGVSVAFLGLYAGAGQNVGLPNVLVKDPILTAMEWVPRLRVAEGAELVILVVHTQSAGQYATYFGNNTALRLAERVAGVDGILATQGHQQISIVHRGVPIVQPAAFGQSFTSLSYVLGRRRDRWSVRSFNPQNIAVTSTHGLDPLVLQRTEQARADETAYLNTHATTLGHDLDGRWSTVEPSLLVQLLHEVQRRVTSAQLSATPSPGAHIFIPKGATSVRQFYALAPNEYRIARIRITGAQLKLYLEHSARYFNFSYLPDLINPGVPLADYDMVGGCSYSLDISRPVGWRVSDLKFNNQPVLDSQTFTMAISTYRLYGGGGYMEAIGFRGEAEMISYDTIRNSLLEYVLSRPTLNVTTPTRWRTIPFIDRERVLSVYKR